MLHADCRILLITSGSLQLLQHAAAAAAAAAARWAPAAKASSRATQEHMDNHARDMYCHGDPYGYESIRHFDWWLDKDWERGACTRVLFKEVQP